MYTIGHNFNVGAAVWVVDGTEVRNCEVTHIVLEVSHNETDVINETVFYHVNPFDTVSNKIYVRDESEVFPTFADAVMFLSDDSLTYPSESTNTVEYEYTINDMVWTFDEDLPLECEVIKVVIDMLRGTPTTISYNLLAQNWDYSSITREESEIYATELAAMDYIKSIVNARYS